MKSRIWYIFAILILLVIIAVVFKQLSSDIVQTIHIFKAQSQNIQNINPPPPGGWTFETTGPHPSKIQGKFDRDDKMYLGLVFNKSSDEEINLSRVVFFDKKSGSEEKIEVSPSALGPFYPGGKYLVGFENPWDVPKQSGEYELRIYLEDNFIASALFQVN